MKLRNIFVINAVLLLLFVLANYAVWDMVNSNTHLGHTSMNPINIVESMWGDVVDGNVERIDGLSIMFNFPFWLFFVSVAVNLFFIFKQNKKANVQTN